MARFEEPQRVVYVRQGNTVQTFIMALMLLLGGAVVAMGLLGVTPADIRNRAGIQAAPTTQPTAMVKVQPTPVVIYQPAPVVYQQVDQAPPQIAIDQPPAPATAVPEAPVQVQPQPARIVVHERPEQGQNIVTGNGACAVGGNVARRCGK